MTDNIKLPLVATSDHPEFPVLAWSPLELAEINRLMREAVRLNAQAVPCDCTTEIHADGTRKTWCGSDQMRRATEEGHAFAAAPQPAQPLTGDKDALLLQELEPDLEAHEYELWGQNVKADFVTVEKARAYAREAVRLNAQAVPDTREMFNAGWCAAARFCDREDAVYDGLVGPGGCPAFESAYRDAWTELSAAPQPAQPLTDEQAHGIGVKS